MRKKIGKKVVSVFLAVTFCTVGLMTGCGDKTNSSSSGNDKKKEASGWALADQIVEDVKKNEPKFDDYKVDITDFGAEVKTAKITDKEEEKTLAKSNTEAINKAIADVSAHKGKDGKLGGTVVIPDGYTYSGAIHLQDNVNLNLSDGAYLMFTTDYAQYPNVLTRWEGVELYNYSPMIYAYQKKNIAITGKGIMDAQATKEEYWLPWKNTDFLQDETQTEDRNSLFKMGEENIDVEQRIFGEGHYLRPAFMQTYECENVLIEDITINNAPFWMVHPVFTNYLTIRGLTLESHGYNNDGIDPDSCQNVVIEKNVFKTGDDCIAIKSGRNADGRKKAVPSENIVAQNNTYVTGKGACVTIGSEMSGDIRNIFYRDNTSEETVEHLQAISIKTNADRGGIVENIYVKGIEAKNTIDRAVLITMFYEEGDTKVTTPTIRNIFIEDSTFKSKDPEKEKDVISIWGYSRSMIENVNFTNCTFEGVDSALNLHNVKDISFKNTTVNGKKLPEGEFKPEENTGLVSYRVTKSSISLGYTSGVDEDTLNPTFVVSDTIDGEYGPVENSDTKEKVTVKLAASGSEVKLLKIDSTKYYKFKMTVNGTEWESEPLYLQQ